MADYTILFDANSNILRVTLYHSTTFIPLTGLAFNSAGLVIGTIADNEATTTAYTVTGATIETVAALGTYAAPTATKCRFAEVDATNHPGVYEVHLADARYGVASAKRLSVSFSGATNLMAKTIDIDLVRYNPQDSVRLGLTALPNAAADAAGGLPISDAGGLDLDAQIGTDIDAILVDTGTTLDGRIPAALVSGRIDASVGAVAANAITAASIAAGAIDNATFAADVGSTAFATNVIAIAVDKAIIENNLDHLALTATAAADMTAEVADNTILSRIVGNGDTSTFDPALHGLLPIRTTIGLDILLETTIATLASQVSFTLTAGSADNDAFNGCIIAFKDATTETQRAVGMISDYVGATKTVTLFRDAGIYTIAVGDTVAILAPR